MYKKIVVKERQGSRAAGQAMGAAGTVPYRGNEGRLNEGHGYGTLVSPFNNFYLLCGMDSLWIDAGS